MTGPTINEVLDAWAEARRKTVAEPTGIRYITAALRPLLGGEAAADVDQDMVDRYIAVRAAAGILPQTSRRNLQALVAALRMAFLAGKIRAMPQIILPPAGPARSRVLEREEARRLLEEARKHSRLYLFVALGLATGARRRAICELTWDRVDMARGMIDFRAPHPRATRRKGRAVARFGAELGAILAQARPDSGVGPVVGLSPAAVYYHFRLAVRRAGLGPEVTPHTLRHTAATTMVRSVPLILVSRMLGHSNTAITEAVYVHMTADDLRPAAEATAALLTAVEPPGKAQHPPGFFKRIRVRIRCLMSNWRPLPDRSALPKPRLRQV